MAVIPFNQTKPNQTKPNPIYFLFNIVYLCLQIIRMYNPTLLPTLPDPLWLGVVTLDMVTSMVQIEINGVLLLN